MGMESCRHQGRGTEDGILAYEARLRGLPMGAESCLYRKRAEDGISPTGNIKTQTLSAQIRKSLSDEHKTGTEALITNSRSFDHDSWGGADE